MSTQNYSKEVIKNRMYRHAMDYWGVKKVENLDPFVKILFEALSCENFSLSHDIETSQSRILDKIAICCFLISWLAFVLHTVLFMFFYGTC